MRAKREIEKRVSRMMNGELRIDDLQAIFAWLRFQTRGRFPIISDLGDAVSHRFERDRGITWTRGTDFFDHANWMIAAVHDPSLRTKEKLERACWATFSTIKPHEMRKLVGVRPKHGKKLLSDALAKLGEFNQSNMAPTSPPFTENETKIFEYCSQRVVTPDGFSQDDLCSEFFDCLEANDINTEGGVASDSQIAEFLALFTIIVLHGTSLMRDGNELAKLQLFKYEGCLSVNVVADVLKGSPGVVCAIFLTNLKFPDRCTERLLQSHDGLKDLLLDITPDLNLDLLV